MQNDLARRSILSRTQLNFDYKSLSEEMSERIVRPLEIEVWENVLTLTAWCETRSDFRVFRLDRMESVKLGDHGFRPEIGKRLQDYLGKQNAKPNTNTGH